MTDTPDKETYLEYLAVTCIRQFEDAVEIGCILPEKHRARVVEELGKRLAAKVGDIDDIFRRNP